MGKPAFDPSKPFSDAGSAEKPKFDPGKSYQAADQDQEGKPSAAEAFMGHGGNMLTLGYLPQLAAATQPAVDKAWNAITGSKIPDSSYVQNRDQNIKTLKEGEESHHDAALTGKITGGILGAVGTPLPGLGFLGKGIIGSAARGGAYGAIVGGASNPGDREGVVDPVQIDDRLSNAERGVGIGAITGGLGAGLSKGAQIAADSPQTARSYAALKALKAAGARKLDFKKALSRGDAEELGGFALDNGLVKAGDSAETVGAKSQKLNDEAGGKISSIYSEAEKSIPGIAPNSPASFTGLNIARDRGQILADAEAQLGNHVDKKAALSKLSDYLDELEAKYGKDSIPPGEANTIKSALDEKIKYSRNPVLPDPATEQAMHTARTGVAKAIDTDVEALGNSSGNKGLIGDLNEANSRYGKSKQLSKMADDKVASEEANRVFGLTDTIAGAAGSGLGGYLAHKAGGDDRRSGEAALIMGLLAAGGNKFGRTYGPALLASGANNASKLLSVTAAPAGRAATAAGNAVNEISPGLISRFLSEAGTANRVDQSGNPPELDLMSSTPGQYKVDKGLIKKGGK